MEANLGLKTLCQIHEIHTLILKGHTGGTKVFAERMKMPVTTFVHRLDALRNLGADIVFDRIQNSYVYTNNFEFEFHVKHS